MGRFCVDIGEILSRFGPDVEEMLSRFWLDLGSSKWMEKYSFTAPPERRTAIGTPSAPRSLSSLLSDLFKEF